MENLFDITFARKFHFLSIFYVCFIHKIIFAFLHPMEKVFPPFSLLFHFVLSLICYFQSNKKKSQFEENKKVSDRNFSIKTILFFLPCFVWLSCCLLKVAKVVKKNKKYSSNQQQNKTDETEL